MTEDVGVVLGSEDAAPLDFWIGVKDGCVVQLDDLIVAHATLPDGMAVAYYGIVDQVRKRFEGRTFDSDAFRAAEGTLPVATSYAAHVQVTRIDPEVFAPPQPGDPVAVVRGEAFAKALAFDQMEKRVPIGLTRTGEVVYANLEFLDGTRGAHMSISGISGVATKTSYATFLIYAMFTSGALGLDAANSKALVFNVKGEDLLWLDKPNNRLDEKAIAAYGKLGLPVGPFPSVGFYAPAKKHVDVPIPDTGSRQEGVSAYLWSVREFARDHLLRFAFADAEDSRQQVSFVVTRVERRLEAFAKDREREDRGGADLVIDGVLVRSFDDLCDVLNTDRLSAWLPDLAKGTLEAFQRRMFAAAQHLGHLVRGDAGAASRRIKWENHQVTVIDLHNLHSSAQLFVVGVLLKRMLDEKEQSGTSRPLVFCMLDELNKYAPRTGYSPIRDVLLDIAERGRSLGVSLIGAQQTASEVERRVVSNAALRIVGRLDAGEAGRDEYGHLVGASRARASILQPGTMIVSQPEIPTPLLIRFPFPAWATRRSEVTAPPSRDDDDFDRLGGE